MSDLLSIGVSGVSAYRTALAAVGDNVANAEVEGYARRSVRLRDVNLGGSGIGAPKTPAFGGVEAAAVERAWDDFQAAESRLTASAAGRAEARAYWLGKVENSLGYGELGPGARMGQFFNAGTALAANPRDRAGRLAMLSALEEAAGSIRTTATALATTADGIKGAAANQVDALNADLEALAELNVKLRQAEPGRTSFVSLLDERDRIIDRVAQKVDVSATLADDGTVKLTLSNVPSAVLVDGNQRELVTLSAAADGRLALNVTAAGTTVPLPAGGGSLAGLVDVAAATADKRAEVESIATQFFTEVNGWQAAGEDLAGNPGAALLSMTAGAASLRLAVSDPDAIAAASATSDNGNLLTLSALRDADGTESRFAALVAGTAQAVASAKSEASAAATRRDNSFAARDEISGIDLDREAAELMRFQQAYDASSRIIQVARETLQSILDLF